jgi:mRNA interferase RelE/StbE
MEQYEIVLKPSVEKDFRKLPKNIAEKVLLAIENLGIDPLPRKVTKLEGTEKTFRLRVGDYRIVYEIDSTQKLLTVLHVRHRREVYRNI